MERCCVGFAWTERTLVLMHVWIWMCHCLVYDAPWHKSAAIQTHYTRRYAPADDNVDWIHGTISCWLWTNRRSVGIGACSNLNVLLLDVWCTMTQSQLHTRLLFKHTTTAMMAHDTRFYTRSCWCWLNIWNVVVLALDIIIGCYSNALQRNGNGTWHTFLHALMLMPVEYMEWCRIGFGWTASTLVLVHVWIWMCHCLVYDAPWHDHNHIIGCYSNTPQRRWYMKHDATHPLMMMLIEYMEWCRVGFGWAESTLVLLHVWIRMCCYLVYHTPWHNYNCIIDCYLKTLQWTDGTLVMVHVSFWIIVIVYDHNCGYDGTQFCANLDVDWIYGTVSWWRLINREYVRIDACLNLNVSLLSVSCTMARSQLHTRLLFKTLQRLCWDMAHNSAVVSMLTGYMKRCCIGFGWTDSTLVLVHVWIRMCHIAWCTSSYDAPWHDYNCTLGCYLNTLQRQCTWHTTLRWLWRWLNILYETVPCWLWTNRKYVDHNYTLGCYLNTINGDDTWHTILRWFWCWLNVWNGVVLALDEQRVRWYWCMFEFECVIAWCTMHHDTIVIAYSAAIQTHYNGYDGT